MRNDLSLLAVFDTLYSLRNVTRAAERLNLTQSAVSHALRRLRQTTQDPLFVRTGGMLQPTERARQMAPAVREGLARLGEALTPTGFEPATSQRVFTLAATTYFCALLVPRLIAMARQEAPGVRFRTVPLQSDLIGRLDEGSIDIALGSFSDFPARITVEHVLQEELVWIAAKDNPIQSRTLTRAELLARPRIAFDPARAFPHRVSPARDSDFPTDFSAEHTPPPELYGSDGAAVMVYEAFTAIAVAAGSDLVALVPRQLALAERERLGIEILKTADVGPRLDFVMISRSGASSDQGRDWLRGQVRALTSAISSL